MSARTGERLDEAMRAFGALLVEREYALLQDARACTVSIRVKDAPAPEEKGGGSS